MEEAGKMANVFFNSDLGRLCSESSYRESEYSIITAINSPKSRIIPVIGIIDLLFENNGTIYVIDFKTDRNEHPDQHYAQLAVYYQAVGDIFNKPVKAFIFYLRSGNAPEITEKISKLKIEQFL
jgi:ATP-dependent exoDNAse (exonuclease V) beta subunit